MPAFPPIPASVNAQIRDDHGGFGDDRDVPRSGLKLAPMIRKLAALAPRRAAQVSDHPTGGIDVLDLQAQVAEERLRAVQRETAAGVELAPENAPGGVIIRYGRLVGGGRYPI